MKLKSLLNESTKDYRRLNIGEEEKEQNERRRKRTQKRKVIIKYNTPLCNNNILL